MILTHEEAKALRDSDHSFDVLRLIFDVEAAVLTKLSQGVSVEPVAWMTSYGNVCRDDNKKSSMPFADKEDYVVPLYTVTAIAAARVKALEDAAVVCENESCSCCWTEDATEMASHLQDAIRALKGGAA